MLRAWIMGCSLAVLAASPVLAQDAAEGEKVFKRCQACHVINAETNRVGPHLVGVVGRKAGAVEGFKYSEAMQAKGQEGMVWDEANLDKYLENPKGFIAKNKMAFAGLKKPEERAAVIAYLREAAGSS
jgi:cytochrome c